MAFLIRAHKDGLPLGHDTCAVRSAITVNNVVASSFGSPPETSRLNLYFRSPGRSLPGSIRLVSDVACLFPLEANARFRRPVEDLWKTVEDLWKTL